MTLTREMEVVRLLGRFYEAALDERLWPAVIEDLLRVVNFDKAAFSVVDIERGRMLSTRMINCTDEVQTEFFEHYHLVDPKVGQLLRQPDLQIAYDYQTVTEQQMNRHEYFDWLKRTCDCRYHLAGYCKPSDQWMVTLGMARRAKLGHVQADDLDLFRFLYTHFERSLQVSFRLGRDQAMRQATGEVLDDHPLAIIMLDRNGRILYANSRARKLPAIGLGTSGITLSNPKEHRRLQELLTCAIAMSLGIGLSSGGIMSIQRIGGRRPLSVTVAPLHGSNNVFGFGRPCATVMIADPDLRQLLPEELLRNVYHLTRAEARLAVLLATGIDLCQAAEQLSVSRNTARTHLARILAKTNTKRQAELVAALLRTGKACSTPPDTRDRYSA